MAVMTGYCGVGRAVKRAACSLRSQFDRRVQSSSFGETEHKK